jgi:propionyl-CoA synthetase
MYTAGTTGKPKGVIRDNGGHAVALTWSMRAVYDIGPGDVFWAASDAGWQPGHSYGAYAPLLAGASTVVFEGQPIGTPDAGVYWEVIERLGIKAILVPASAVQAIRSQDPEGFLAEGRDLSSLQAVFVAGEWVDAETPVWTRNLLGVPVVDQYWQTETGQPVCCICRGIEELPTRSGSVNRCVPGYDVVALDAQGQPLEPGLEGALAVRLPLPPGALATLWRDDGGSVRAFLDPCSGFYCTGDGGWIDVDGYVFVAGRLNDVTA